MPAHLKYINMFKAAILACGVFSIFLYLGIKMPAFADDYLYAGIPSAETFSRAWEMYFTW